MNPWCPLAPRRWCDVLQADKFTMRSSSPSRLLTPPHLNELGMKAQGRRGGEDWRIVRLRGCHSARWSGLPAAKVTKGDNNSSRACQTQNCCYDGNGKITPADTPSAATEAAAREVWLSSKCTGMWVVETYYFFFWRSLRRVCAPGSHFHCSHLSMCLREMTPRGHFLFDTLNKTQLEPLRTWWRSPDAILFSLPGALVHFISLFLA